MNLLIAEDPLIVLPTLAKKYGVEKAIIIQQVYWWTIRAKPDADGERWIYNTYEDWAEQFPFWSTDRIRRYFRDLEEKGLVCSRQPEGLSRRKHYSINWAHPDIEPYYRLIQPADSGGTQPAESAGCLIPTKTTNKEEPPTPLPGVSTQDLVDEVWAYYVNEMKPRRKNLDKEERAVIRAALKVATAEECKTAITHCSESDFHMKRGKHVKRQGARYNKLSQILKGRRGKETTRERIDFWLDYDPRENSRGRKGATHEEIDQALDDWVREEEEDVIDSDAKEIPNDA